MTPPIVSVIPEGAKEALKNGQIGLALKLVRPTAVKFQAEGEVPDEIFDFIDRCIQADREVVKAHQAA